MIMSKLQKKKSRRRMFKMDANPNELANTGCLNSLGAGKTTSDDVS